MLGRNLTPKRSTPSSRMRPRPPTQGEKNIEAARRHLCELYHQPPAIPELSNWYTLGCSHPYIAARVQDLYTDYSQTSQHHGVFYVAKLRLLLTPTGHPLEEIYTRVLKLYDERLTYIHCAGIARVTLWVEWHEDCVKSDALRNEAFIAACESTLSFHEQDYVHRKLEFITEVYALLETCDAGNASRVVRDLEAMWPWTKGDFIMRLTQCVVGYDRVKLADLDVVREEEEMIICENSDGEVLSILLDLPPDGSVHAGTQCFLFDGSGVRSEFGVIQSSLNVVGLVGGEANKRA